jgi:hypothetical protein
VKFYEEAFNMLRLHKSHRVSEKPSYTDETAVGATVPTASRSIEPWKIRAGIPASAVIVQRKTAELVSKIPVRIELRDVA